MEASYFYVIVLPLGIFVFLLTGVAYYYARKEELARRKWKKLVNEYTRKQLGWREATDAESYEMELKKAWGLLDGDSVEGGRNADDEKKRTDPD